MHNDRIFFENNKAQSLIKDFVRQVFLVNFSLKRYLPNIYFYLSENTKKTVFKYQVKIIFNHNENNYFLVLNILDSYFFEYSIKGIESLLYFIKHHAKIDNINQNYFDIEILQDNILNTNHDFESICKNITKHLGADLIAIINKKSIIESYSFISDGLFCEDLTICLQDDYLNQLKQSQISDIHGQKNSFIISHKVFNMMSFEVNQDIYVIIVNSICNCSKEQKNLKLIVRLFYEKFQQKRLLNIQQQIEERMYEIIDEFPVSISVKRKDVFVEQSNQTVSTKEDYTTIISNKKYKETGSTKNIIKPDIYEYDLNVSNDQRFRIDVRIDRNEHYKLEKQWDTDIKEFDNMFEILPIPVCIIDEALEIIQYNKSFENLFATLLGSFNRFIIMKSSVNKVFKNWRNIISKCFSSRYEESLDVFSLDDCDYTFLSKFNLIESDTNKIIITMSDLTEFIKLSGRVKSIERQYSELINDLPMTCVLIINENHEIMIALGSEVSNIFLNDNSKSLISPEQLINSSIYNYFDDLGRCFFREHLIKADKKSFCNQEFIVNQLCFTINTKKLSNYFSQKSNDDLKTAYIMVFHNITEKKQLLDKITDSEKKLNAFYQNSAIGMFKVSPEGKILKCNPAFCQLLKLPYDYNISTVNLFKDIHLSNEFLDEYSSCELINIIENYSGLHEPNTIPDFNKLYLRYDKKVLYVVENLRPVYRHLKVIDYYEGTVINMTDFIYAKNMSKENELKYKLLAENQNDIIITLNNDLELSYCSPAIEKILNYSVDEIFNIDLFNLIDEDNLNDLKKMFKDLFIKHCKGTFINSNSFIQNLRLLFNKLSHFTFEICLLDKNFQKIWTEITISKLIRENSQSVGYLIVIKDINDKIIMKNKLQMFENKYHNVFDYSPVGIIIINSSGMIIDNNSAILKILHKRKLINEHISSLPISKRQVSFIVGSLKKYQRLVNYEIEYDLNIDKKQLNSVIHLRLNCGIFKDNNSTDQTHESIFFILAEDISKETFYRKHIENNLKEKELLLQEIHHRVKNNLQIVCSMLFLEANNSKNKKVIKALEESYNRIRSMAMIHEKLYSEKSFDVINMRKYIEDLSGYLLKSLKPDNLKLEILYFIENISLSISQAISCGLIINELLSNALKYAFTDNNKISKPDNNFLNPRICIYLEKKSDSILLTVQDNGEAKSSTFNPFNKKTLGLHLVRTLTQQLHGKLKWFYNQGLIFKISFPIEPNLKGGYLEEKKNSNHRG